MRSVCAINHGSRTLDAESSEEDAPVRKKKKTAKSNEKNTKQVENVIPPKKTDGVSVIAFFPARTSQIVRLDARSSRAGFASQETSRPSIGQAKVDRFAILICLEVNT